MTNRRAVWAVLLILMLVAASSAAVSAQDDSEVEDLQATVEAIETEIAEIRLAGIPEVDEIDQDEFDALVEEITAEAPAYGPEDGEIQHDPSFIRLSYAAGYYDDFLLQATFTNPFEEDDADFDFGVELRINGDYTNPSRVYVIVDSGDNWLASVGTDEEWSAEEEETLGDGRYRGLNTDAGGENQMTLIVDGQVMHLAINGEYVTSVGLPESDPGSVAIGTGFFTGDTVEGFSTPFTDFAVWEI